SHYQVEWHTQNLSGLITWEHHMCVKSCIRFTGPYSDLEHCPKCGQSCYNEKELEESDGLRMVPVGPQLQAHWKNPQTAMDMFYWWEKTEELQQECTGSNDFTGLYDDILCSTAYLDLVDNGKINGHDSVLMLSIDGAQLYESKQSDCWIYIWILIDLALDKHYKI
ncbi:hypothetical protein BDM02DRAFT_3103597, partial [Thelephora ganbajun]